VQLPDFLGHPASQLPAVFLGLTFSGLALALEWNLQRPQAGSPPKFTTCTSYVMILCTAIFVGVFGFMFWSVYAHRKSKGHQAEQFHENTTVEMLWTVIPAIILVIIAWPATRLVVAQKDTAAADLTIKVTGIQWKWAYDYIDGEGEGIGFILDPDHAARTDRRPQAKANTTSSRSTTSW